MAAAAAAGGSQAAAAAERAAARWVEAVASNRREAVVALRPWAAAAAAGASQRAERGEAPPWEGVETKAQETFLFEAGCQEVQGYFYSKPVDKKEIEEYIIGR